MFEKLHQGCGENDEVLALANARAEAEEQYGIRLRDIQHNFSPKKGGFGRDDGASLRKAYEGITSEMSEEGKNHIQVAENIKRMVLDPFGKWADEHRQRVDYSHGVLKGKLKNYEKELSEVHKAQKRYFNKCRVLEDLKENELNDDDPELQHRQSNESSHDTSAAIAAANAAQGHRDQQAHPQDDDQHSSSGGTATIADLNGLNDPVDLGGDIYSPEEAGELFRNMLENIPRKSIKVSILGTYDNVSTGDQIVEWALKNISKKIGDTSLSHAERFGQSLVNAGFLRLVGHVGSKFANSSVLTYQWRKKAFVQAGKDTYDQRDLISPYLGGYIGDTINNYINNPHPDETPDERLTREVSELDQRYKVNVSKLDDLRCNLEESIIDHLKFMERCEFDRLKAIKAVYLDLLASMSNVVPSIQSAIDKELLFQETVNPANDLRYILESYRTGSFSPKVTVYDNYYNSTEDQTFGVDLELRARGDKKKVPYIVSAILSHMDSQYPDLDNDDVRLGVWTVSVPLNSTHRLRKKLNTGRPFSKEILKGFEGPIVASVLKLYLVELPDSLIPSQYYDIFKTIYSQHGNDEDSRPRISAIQNTFAQLRVTNIATLDAIVTHLTRLTSITKAGTEYLTQLAQEFSHCILRPRTQSSLTIGDRHAFRLVYDLLIHKDQIFSELKRNNSGLSSRTGSTNESRTPSMTSPSLQSNSPPTHTVRRASLQNRLDALSMRIRKSNNTTPAESREVSTSTTNNAASPGSSSGGKQSIEEEQEGDRNSQSSRQASQEFNNNNNDNEELEQEEDNNSPATTKRRPLPDITRYEGGRKNNEPLHPPQQLQEPEGPSFHEEEEGGNPENGIDEKSLGRGAARDDDNLTNTEIKPEHSEEPPVDDGTEGGHENPVVID